MASRVLGRSVEVPAERGRRVIDLINLVFYCVGALVTVSAVLTAIIGVIVRLAYVHYSDEEYQWIEDDL